MKINLKVITNAKKNEIVEVKTDYIKLKLKAPPVDGKANKDIIEFLSKEFNVPKSYISIIKGEKTKNKVIEIKNLNKEDFLKNFLKISS